MEKEQISELTARITRCNRTQLIVVLYDMAEAYMQDAVNAHAVPDRNAYKEAVRKATRVIRQLREDLDFKYEISYELLQMYLYIERALALAMVKFDVAEIEHAKRVLKPLHEAFEELAEADSSAPLMGNTQQIYAGMTYGKGNLEESYGAENTSRGFLA